MREVEHYRDHVKPLNDIYARDDVDHFGIPYIYDVKRDDETIATISFQNDMRYREGAISGLSMFDLLEILNDRLNYINQSEVKDGRDEFDIAIDHVLRAIEILTHTDPWHENPDFDGEDTEWVHPYQRLFEI